MRFKNDAINELGKIRPTDLTISYIHKIRS